MLKSRFFIIISVVIFILISGSSYAANVLITDMDLTSKINLEAEIETRGMFQISFDGGYKYQGKLMFQYYNTDLENNVAPALAFDGAQASINGIFHVLDLTYWTGFYGILGEGKHYKGHLYHGESGFDYNGYLPILGTGLIFGTKYYDILNADLYIYQRYGSDYLNSFDLSFGLNKDPLFFSIFSGVSDNIYRVGTQIIYLGETVELYLTMGDPNINNLSKINFDDFYFLLEEWFKMNNWNLILSVFSRPKLHYNYISREYVNPEESNDIDFNFDLNYEPETSYFSGGGEVNIQTNRYENFGIYVSPYVSVYTSGLTWKVKVNFNLISESRDFITAYLNIKASF